MIKKQPTPLAGPQHQISPSTHMISCTDLLLCIVLLLVTHHPHIFLASPAPFLVSIASWFIFINPIYLFFFHSLFSQGALPSSSVLSGRPTLYRGYRLQTSCKCTVLHAWVHQHKWRGVKCWYYIRLSASTTSLEKVEFLGFICGGNYVLPNTNKC